MRYLGESAHLVLCQAAACPSRRGGGVRPISLHSWPHFQVMHPLPEHARNKQGRLSDVCLKTFRVCCILSPIFAKQGDSGSPDGDSPARSINVPHRKSNLGILGKVRILDRQPQPLVPATKKSTILGFFLSNPISTGNKQTDSNSLPTCAECFVRGANRQSQGFSFGKHLTCYIEVGAVLLVEAGEPEHGVLKKGFVALLLPFSF